MFKKNKAVDSNSNRVYARGTDLCQLTFIVPCEEIAINIFEYKFVYYVFIKLISSFSPLQGGAGQVHC